MAVTALERWTGRLDFAARRSTRIAWNAVRDAAMLLADTLRTGDKPDCGGLPELFSRAFHDPCYTGYMAEDSGGPFGEAGFQTDCAGNALLSRITTFRRS